MAEIIGRATRAGWKRRKSGDKFEIVIELDAPPGWPIAFVWGATPIALELRATGTDVGTVGEKS
ncbi:hypothetical protein [Bradyrhizobium tunisiense]|uniref:hypothetical protein n=1 Tax=Bradyrhizobium tunisiense TaxID=3278709 RepID=UPI0035D548DD